MGGWVWKKIAPMLEEGKHQVYPVTLTGTGERVHLASPDVGMETAIRDVLNVIKYNELEDVVLVGHSFAGKVAAVVADRIPERVKTILYLDAARPAKVRTPQCSFDPTSEFGRLIPGEWSIALTEKIIDSIGKDVQGADREWMMSMATPWPLKHASDPITLSKNFDSVKTSYVFCNGSGDPVDEIIEGKWGKLEGPFKIIESGHWPMITKPQETVQSMLDLANSRVD